jgi:hypothetical protein
MCFSYKPHMLRQVEQEIRKGKRLCDQPEPHSARILYIGLAALDRMAPVEPQQAWLLCEATHFGYDRAFIGPGGTPGREGDCDDRTG